MILFAGFQAAGTRGARMLAGERTVRIYGEDVPINAEVVSITGMSAHADSNEILAWLQTAKVQPRGVFLNHGEPAAADSLRLRIKHELKLQASVPLLGQQIEV
jgi:metallo-beta-lactamase family protein